MRIWFGNFQYILLDSRFYIFVVPSLFTGLCRHLTDGREEKQTFLFLNTHVFLFLFFFLPRHLGQKDERGIFEEQPRRKRSIGRSENRKSRNHNMFPIRGFLDTVRSSRHDWRFRRPVSLFSDFWFSLLNITNGQFNSKPPIYTYKKPRL